MRFGVQLPNSGPFASQSAISAVAQEAEGLGYASVWVHDHITRKSEDNMYHFAAGAFELWGDKEEPTPDFYESLTTLSYVAGQTRKVELGTGILVLPLRNPVELAKQTSVLDRLSGGRLKLGVGVGGVNYVKDELEAVGQGQLFKPRARVVKEWMEVLKAVWTQKKASFAGEFVRFKDIDVFPKPIQKPHPPLLYGALSEKGLRLVAESADGWLPLYLLPKEIRERKVKIMEYAKRAGRRSSEIPVVAEQYLSISRDKQDAIRRTAKTFAALSGFKKITYQRMKTNEQGVRRLTEPGRNMLGDPATLIKYAEAFERAGVEHMILRIISFGVDDMLNQMRTFESGVMRSF